MYLWKCIIILIVILNSTIVRSKSSDDIIYLRDHFITNLLEENREKFSMQLTDDVEQSIDLKINAFLNEINKPQVRKKRDTPNDLLLNEKPMDVNILKGFEYRGKVPINFPQDICMFKIKGISFAAALAFGKPTKEGAQTDNTLVLFKRNNGTFLKIYEYKSKYVSKIDCEAVNDIGYVAVMNSINVLVKSEELLSSGSFVFRVEYIPKIIKVKISKFQTFAEANQIGVNLWVRDAELYLVYTYQTEPESPLEKCPVFKLSASTFNPIDTLQCQNARFVEFFTVHHIFMALVGNYRENNGTTNAFSSIMRYDLTQRRFVEHQKIYTNAVTVGKYFYLDHQNQRQHFLFIGNSYEVGEFGTIETDVMSIIYKWVDGFFIPLQTVNVTHVRDVSAILGQNNEFNLLITSKDHEVQIYFYDGWKFMESSLDFTGSAFDEGVTSIRSYKNIIENTTTIVISNANHFGSHWNIYSPVYVKRTDTSQLKENILNWCSETFAKIDEFNVEEADELLKNAISMTDPNNDRVSFSGDLFIQNSQIKSINANQLKRRDSVFNMTSIEKINELAQRASHLERDIRKLNEKIGFTKATTRQRRQVTSNDDEPLIHTLYVNNFLDVKRINGRAVSDIVYQSNRRNPKIRNIIANEIGIKEELFVDDKVDEIEMSVDNILLNAEQTLRPMAIKHLNARSLDTLTVNGENFDDFFKLLRLKVDQKIPNTIHQLNVDVLNVKDLFNGANITNIFQNSLKTVDEQTVRSNMNIKNLYTNGIIFRQTMETVSKVPVSHLVNIKDNNPIKIMQDIQFDQELIANELNVEERINNIRVENRELQVLRKRGRHEQVVVGEKHFDVINLKEPIMLKGKIESKTLEKMNPIATIDKDLILEGDYVIKGPVTVRRFINVSENILTSDEKYNFRKLAESGLNLYTTTSTNNKFNFKSIIEVRNNFNARMINGKMTDSFVKTNYDKEQVVGGTKVFKKSLFVDRGTVQADVINDVDLKRLNQTTLKKNHPFSQFVDGNIEFEKISVDQVITKTAKINEKDINLILNMQKPQSLQQLSANFLKVRNMKTTNMQHKLSAKIFDSDLNFLIDDTVTTDTFYESSIAQKNFGHLLINQLEFVDENEWKSVISNFNNMIVEELNVTESYEFKNMMRVGNLHIFGTINGVKFEDMTQNWLKLEDEQIFTAPQAINAMKVDQNINLKNGLINGIEIDKLMNESIWINEPISLDTLEVEGVLSVREGVLTPLINGATFEESIILNNSAEPQLMNKLKINKVARIYDLKFFNINGIDLKEFWNYFTGTNDGVNLMVNGIMQLEQANILSLNNVQLNDLYEKTWLRNRDTTLSGDRIKFFGDVRIEDTFYSEFVNRKNLDIVGKNYLSRSRDQLISGNLNILGTLTAEKSFHVSKIIVPKFIKVDDHTLLNITHFQQNVLSHGINQNVTGTWRVSNLVLYGNYDGLINGLNIQTDVLHAGNSKVEITGHKKFKSLEAFNVNTQYVNDIDMDDWIRNSVKLNSSTSQAIQGHVVFKKPVQILYNLDVHGTINGIDIRPETILTKSGDYQVIKGDVVIKSMPHDANGFKQIFIENLKLNDGTINGRNWNEFYENAFTKDSNFMNSERIIFENVLHMETIKTDKKIYGVDVKEFLEESSTNKKLIKFKDNMEYLTKVGDDLMRSLIDDVAEMSHFEHHQTINGNNAVGTILFSYQNDRVTEYVLGIHQQFDNEGRVIFYKWNPQDSLFHLDTTVTTLTYTSEFYQMSQFRKIIYDGVECLLLEHLYLQQGEFVQTVLQYDSTIKSFKPVMSKKSDASMRAFTWRDGSMPCYGASRQSFEDIIVHCDGKPPTVLKTRPIRHIWSGNNILVMVNDEDKIQVIFDDKPYTLPSVINPAGFAGIIYNNKIFIAVRSDKADETVHRGDINIFVSSLNDVKFEHLQKLTLNIPTMMEFSKAPSGDLLLYILTRDPTKTLNIYSYAGSSNFIELISDTTMITEATDFSVIKIGGKTEVLSVLSKDNIYILHATLVKY